MLSTARWTLRPFPLTTLIRLYKLLKNSLGSFDPLVGRLASTYSKMASHFTRSRFAVGAWWRMTGSNRRPPACKAGALPAELIPLLNVDHRHAASLLTAHALFKCTAPFAPSIACLSPLLLTGWWVWLVSNQRPPPYQDGALTN